MTTAASSSPAHLSGGIAEIRFPRAYYAAMVSHACRKLTGHYLACETAELKAFGLLGGVRTGEAMTVTSVFPLIVNMRHDPQTRQDMDEIVNGYAIPSETPMSQRGWIAHPAEVIAADQACDDAGWQLFGNYHTHRVPWPQDPVRSSCTELDRQLAADTQQWTIIISVVDLHRPVVRAYFEGSNEAEVPIRVAPPLEPATSTGPTAT